MRFLITAGPTREPIDPVRFLSNRSSGKMGYALAEAALERGYEGVLVSGPVAIDPPAGVAVVRVETAEEMHRAVKEHLSDAEVAIFCAAVSDYRAARVAEQKIKKTATTLTLALERTPDILGDVRSVFGFSGFLVGFAAETGDIESYAREKLIRKGCDLLVANDVSRTDIGFDHDSNEVVLFHRDGTSEVIPRASKREVARNILGVIEACWRGAGR